MIPLAKPIAVFNADGTTNEHGTINHRVEIKILIAGRWNTVDLLITGLGKHNMILGFPWLQKHNPIIDWQKGTINWTPNRRTRRKWHFKRKEELPNDDLDLFAIERNPDGTLTTRKLTAYDENPDEYTQESLIQFVKEKVQTASMNVHINLKTTASQNLAMQAKDLTQKNNPEDIVPPEFHPFLHLFEEAKSERFPPKREWDHKIELKEGFIPKSFKLYSLTPQEQKELDTFIEENLRKGYIRPSDSPMASPFFFVAKKDGKLHPCQDYRYLNEWTVKNAYPLPLISSAMDQLVGAKWFTKLDVRLGYNNVRMADGHQWKAAFKTNRGLFEPLVMFFGLCNSPATFQAMMDSILKDPLHKSWIIVYMDDILIFAKNKEDLTKYTNEVLKILDQHDLFLKTEKCLFYQREIEFLGLRVSEGKVSMDPVKLSGIRDWPIPTSTKGLRSFLGFGNFYRKFIRNYSQIAGPLNDLLRKGIPFSWNENAQKAFDELKKRFTEEPVLCMPDSTKPFEIECDASNYASGAVLYQKDMNGDRHPCSFISKTFSPAERNYEIYDRELLAVI